MDRRDWVKGAMGLSIAAGLAGTGEASTAVAKDSPLALQTLRAALVQTRIGLPDPANPQPVLRSNLAHMLEWLDRTQAERRHDLVMFHELPLTGLSFSWPRSTVQKLCIEVPGPEVQAIAAKARQYRCHVTFGAYIVDRDWPNHFMLAIIILGPDGQVIDVQWKARNIMGAFGNMELMTTTRPPCRWRMPGNTACSMWKAAFRLLSSMVLQRSGVSSRSVRSFRLAPALATSRSIWPR